MPKVSVIVPVYNVARFLQDCIDSLMAQTFRDYEVIFVDDASTDNSLEILRANEEKYPQMRVIASAVNGKQGTARNIGIRASSGPWIAFTDSDDIVSPDFLQNMIDAAKEDTDAVFCQYASLEESGTYADVLATDKTGGGTPLIDWDVAIKQLNDTVLDDAGIERLMVYPIGGAVCGIWRRDLFEKNNVFFPEGSRYEDNGWTTLVKAYLHKVIFVEKVGYYYRKNSMSTVHKRNQEYQFDRIKIENGLLQELKERQLLERFWQAEEYLYTQRYVFNSFWMFLTTFDVTPKREIKQILSDLKRNAPKWRRNLYYQRFTPNRKKLHDLMCVACPFVYISLWRTKQKLNSIIKQPARLH